MLYLIYLENGLGKIIVICGGKMNKEDWFIVINITIALFSFFLGMCWERIGAESHYKNELITQLCSKQIYDFCEVKETKKIEYKLKKGFFNEEK